MMPIEHPTLLVALLQALGLAPAQPPAPQPVAVVATVPAAPTLRRTDWERFLQPAPYREERLADWLGYKPALEPEDPPIHYYLRDLPPYAGGVDLFADGHGAIESARFYLAIGPLYTDEHIAKARTVHTGVTLDQVLAWYGAPAEHTTAKRSGAERLIYHFQGDAKRELVFDALPGSHELHSILADRDED